MRLRASVAATLAEDVANLSLSWRYLKVDLQFPDLSGKITRALDNTAQGCKRDTGRQTRRVPASRSRPRIMAQLWALRTRCFREPRNLLWYQMHSRDKTCSDPSRLEDVADLCQCREGQPEGHHKPEWQAQQVENDPRRQFFDPYSMNEKLASM